MLILHRFFLVWSVFRLRGISLGTNLRAFFRSRNHFARQTWPRRTIPCLDRFRDLLRGKPSVTLPPSIYQYSLRFSSIIPHLLFADQNPLTAFSFSHINAVTMGISRNPSLL
jgi:hypothetical protein